MTRVPAYLGNASPATQMLGVFNGLLNITNPGTYTFSAGYDDQYSLFIDGNAVINVTATNAWKYNDASLYSANLGAGLHTLTIKYFNNTGGGGFYTYYSGPDTATNGIIGGAVPNMQAIPASALYGTTANAAAGNGYLNAGQITNAFIVADGATATLDGQGTDQNTTIAGLTIGNGSTLAVNNVYGTGIIGVTGTTTVAPSATLSPASGTLHLIGGVSDSGNGLTKTGAGTLILGASSNFTGNLAVNTGFLQVTAANSLPTGTTTMAALTTIDLNGVAGLAGNLAVSGTGPTNKFSNAPGVIYNSSASAASVTGSVTLNAASTISGYGDITLSGALIDGAGGPFDLTKAGPNTLTLSGNTAGFTGAIKVTQGLLKIPTPWARPRPATRSSAAAPPSTSMACPSPSRFRSPARAWPMSAGPAAWAP